MSDMTHLGPPPRSNTVRLFATLELMNFPASINAEVSVSVPEGAHPSRLEEAANDEARRLIRALFSRTQK